MRCLQWVAAGLGARALSPWRWSAERAVPRAAARHLSPALNPDTDDAVAGCAQGHMTECRDSQTDPNTGFDRAQHASACCLAFADRFLDSQQQPRQLDRSLLPKVSQTQPSRPPQWPCCAQRRPGCSGPVPAPRQEAHPPPVLPLPAAAAAPGSGSRRQQAPQCWQPTPWPCRQLLARVRRGPTGRRRQQQPHVARQHARRRQQLQACPQQRAWAGSGTTRRRRCHRTSRSISRSLGRGATMLRNMRRTRSRRCWTSTW